ncbi:general stress protein [Sporosarcina trichiuri]|uniref:general stress protein n=1 Tax=Sporosarcina trichiuri TaxID=3056445 RepID=UPI0025B332A3|nr:general stress protein [Sporosarcina sp. 0.2-SM1T-5]WJY26677.1 general stress protein [Sporosarcina sp. 0.2-SM1T-5]
MKQKRYAGTYHSIDAVLAKITELKSLGYTKDEIFAVSNTEDNDRMLEDQTDIVLPTREQDGWLARMKFLFTDQEPAKEAFDQLGFNEQQTQAFYNEVKDGGVALFVMDDPDAPTHHDPAGTRGGTSAPTPFDSEGEMTDSGIPLENASEDVEAEENAGRYPRINTNKL